MLPRLQGQLKLTPYLWFHSADPAFDWGAFNPGNDRAAFRQTYLRRVATFDRWAKDLQAWAQQRRLDGKLVIVLCPYLEDNCPNLTAYVNLLNVIRGQQRTDGLSTPMRRSCVGDNIFRVENLPLELHGRYNDVRGHLRNGDVFSNDGNFVWLDAATIPGSRETSRSFTGYGTPTSCGEFIGHQRNALANGISNCIGDPHGMACRAAKPQRIVAT